jgi:proton-dependent oligopeptide transporter, POT family
MGEPAAASQNQYPQGETVPPTRDASFFGQPAALANVFGVEMWERFSFYGMQGILLIYLYYSVAQGGLGIDRSIATNIVGAYGGLVYLSTVLGAWLADRLWGSERLLFWSAFVIMCGHIALGLLPGLLGVGVGLVLVALGSGGLKANATSVVGTLYASDDSRRDAGFSLFYLGINLGAFSGPILTGLLQSVAGFHAGFGLAAVGMAFGLIQYSVGRRRIPKIARVVPNPLPRRHYRSAVLVAVVAVGGIAALAFFGVLRDDNLAAAVILVTAVAAVVLFLTLLISSEVSPTERSRVIAFIPLFAVSVAFWSLYQQQFTVLTIYADTRLNRYLFGWEFPVSWVQSINPIFIIALSGAFAAVWEKLGTRQPSTPVKFGLAAAIMGLAFWMFLPFTNSGPNGTPLLGLVAVLLVFTVAELLISPIGLSASTKLAPHSYRTQMVALFFLSVALGTAIAGELGKYYQALPESGYFGVLGAIAIGVGALMLLSAKGVLSLMKGVR